MSDGDAYVVVGTKVKCDCGSSHAYLRNGTKRDDIGNANIMLGGDVEDKYFTNDFGNCTAAYASSDGLCARSPLPKWYGTNQKISFSTISTKYMEHYYNQIGKCQTLLSDLFSSEVSADSQIGSDLRKFAQANQAIYLEKNIWNGVFGFRGDIYRNVRMSSITDAQADIKAMQDAINKLAENFHIAKPFRILSLTPWNFGNHRIAPDSA